MAVVLLLLIKSIFAVSSNAFLAALVTVEVHRAKLAAIEPEDIVFWSKEVPHVLLIRLCKRCFGSWEAALNSFYATCFCHCSFFSFFRISVWRLRSSVTMILPKKTSIGTL